jgi:hypothetical protein
MDIVEAWEATASAIRAGRQPPFLKKLDYSALDRIVRERTMNKHNHWRWIHCSPLRRCAFGRSGARVYACKRNLIESILIRLVSSYAAGTASPTADRLAFPRSS